MQPEAGACVRIGMDDVPDLRAFGTRLVHCICAFLLGQATAWYLVYLVPGKFGAKTASVFAPVFLVIGVGCACGLAYYAVFEALRRRATRRQPVPAARVLTANRSAPLRNRA